MAKVALLIGVSEYQIGLNPLPAAQYDVEAVQRVLQHPLLCGFDKVTPLINPERQLVEESIEELFADLKKNDLVLLFFSGHGVKDDRGNLYLATRTTRKTAQGKLIRSTAVSSRFIHEIMDNSRSKRQVVILDCCFSGAFAEGLTVKDDGSLNLKEQLGGEGRVVLASSNSTQYSFEQKESNLSIYTQYLIEGIETGAADRDGDDCISVNELHEYASEKVQEISQEMKPEIYAAKEGFKILLARVPITNPKQEYRKKIEQYVRQGEFYISPLEQSRRDSVTPKTVIQLRQYLGLTLEDAIAIENEILRPYWERQIKVLTASADVSIIKILLELLEAKLRENFQQMYQDFKQDYIDVALWLSKTAIETINNSDALFHNVEYAVWTILVGLEILKGKHLHEGGVSPEDWLHFVISLSFLNIGYVRGVCRNDQFSSRLYDIGKDGAMVQLPLGVSDALLAPYSIDRAKQFVKERFSGHRLIDSYIIKHSLELTRFPFSTEGDSQNEMSYPKLIRAAAVISKFSHPKFAKKLSIALFYELNEIGIIEELDYNNLDDFKRNYPVFYWKAAFPYIKNALHCLSLTNQGKQLLVSFYSNLFLMKYAPHQENLLEEQVENQLKEFYKILGLTSESCEEFDELMISRLSSVTSNQVLPLPVFADMDITDALINSFEIKLKGVYREIYGTWKYDYAEIIGSIARKNLKYIDNSDALYHDIDHAIRVTLVGLEILHGKHILEGGVSCEDWLEFVTSLLCANIGYVKGVCRQDRAGSYATGRNGDVVHLPPTASDASLTPYHVDRAKLFIDEQFGGHLLIDAEIVKRNIELTRFPVPMAGDHQDTINYPGLIRASVLIGQLSDLRYLKKAPAIFYEFEEMGINQALGYRNPGDIRQNYSKFYWQGVFPYIRDALRYLSLTQQGKQTLANLYSNVFVVEHEQI